MKPCIEIFFLYHYKSDIQRNNGSLDDRKCTVQQSMYVDCNFYNFSVIEKSTNSPGQTESEMQLSRQW